MLREPTQRLTEPSHPPVTSIWYLTSSAISKALPKKKINNEYSLLQGWRERFGDKNR